MDAMKKLASTWQSFPYSPFPTSGQLLQVKFPLPRIYPKEFLLFQKTEKKFTSPPYQSRKEERTLPCYSFLFLGKKRATHSSILAWKILWTEKPEGPQSMQWQRIEYN